MATTSVRDIKDIAKDIRAILKAAFPATTFSVRIDRYSMGSSCDIRWIDGPTARQVEEAIRPIVRGDTARASYDAQGDYWSGSRHYHCERAFSPAAYQWAIDFLKARVVDWEEPPAYTIASYASPAIKGAQVGALQTASWPFSDAVYRVLQAKVFKGE